MSMIRGFEEEEVYGMVDSVLRFMTMDGRYTVCVLHIGLILFSTVSNSIVCK